MEIKYSDLFEEDVFKEVRENAQATLNAVIKLSDKIANIKPKKKLSRWQRFFKFFNSLCRGAGGRN